MEGITSERQPLRILYLASTPRNQAAIRLGSELQEIRNRLSNSAFEIKDRQAVKPDDVLQNILRYKPHIVHFAAHGLNTGEICFEDELGDSKTVPPDALASLFARVRDYVKCVVINTCFSEVQAKAISKFVPIVIGTKQEITDSAAIKFSTGFYTALDPDLSEKNLLDAFEYGRVAIRFESLPEDLTPIIINGSPEVRFISEVNTAFAGVSQPKGSAIKTLRQGLELTGIKMGLSQATVLKILEGKIYNLELHNAAVQEYERNLLDILKEEMPLSDISTAALQQLQNGLELSDQDVQKIKNKVLTDPNQIKAETWYDRGRKQTGYNNLEKAIDYFTIAIEKKADYSAAYFERGFCHDKLKNYQTAIDDLTKAIEFDNKWELASNLALGYFYRARAYDALPVEDEKQKQECLHASLADWNKSIELNPDEPQAFYGRGMVYEQMELSLEAFNDFTHALELSKPDDNKKSILLAIGRYHFKIGDFDEARKYVEYANANEVNHKDNGLDND